MDGHFFARLNPIRRMAYWQSPYPPLSVLGFGLVALVAIDEPSEFGLRLALVFGLLSLGTLGYLGLLSYQSARKRRMCFRSGDSVRVQAALSEEFESGRSPPRLRALALAGTGDFAAARRALIVADPLCPLPMEAEDQELLLCARIVILAFEGQSSKALGLCRRLAEFPLGCADGSQSRRRLRREGIVALARAVAGAADEGDYSALTLVSSVEPCLYWACRYGVAVACCAKDEPLLACRLVKDAPAWPKESCFRLLHSRLLAAGIGSRPSIHAA